LHSKQFIDKNKELLHAPKTSCGIYHWGLVFNFNRVSLNFNLLNAARLLARLSGPIDLAGCNAPGGGGPACAAAGGGVIFFALSAAFAFALSAAAFALSLGNFDFAAVSNGAGLFKLSRSLAAWLDNESNISRAISGRLI
jgi:hypothetical protein